MTSEQTKKNRREYGGCTFLCLNFTRVILSHCSREANWVVHNLAKFSEDNQHWKGDPSDFIQAVSPDDITILF